MQIDYKTISIQSISIESILHRISGMVELVKNGFEYSIPKLTVFLSNGISFSGFPVACDVSRSLVLHTIQKGSYTTKTTYIQTQMIVGVEIDNIAHNPLLSNMELELPFNKSVSRMQLLRELEKFQEKLESNIEKTISYSIDKNIVDENIPVIFNMAKLINNALLKTSYDNIGKQAINDSINSIVIKDNETTELSLIDGILTYRKQYNDSKNQLSITEAVSKLSDLL